METLQVQTFNQALCASFRRFFSGGLTADTDADRDKQTIANLQSQLADVNFKYNALFNSSDNYSIILDRHLNVVDFNDASLGLFKKMFGKRLAIGQYIGHYLSGGLADPAMENCMRALRGDTFSVERRLAFKNDEFKWWRATYSPAYNHLQHIDGVVFNATEITSRKAGDDKILEQNQKLRAIALMQSHDIRSPLCTLMGLMELLKQENLNDGSGYLQHMDATIAVLDKKIKAIVECASNEE